MNQTTSTVHEDTALRIERIENERGYRLRGEIDLRTHDALAAALAHLEGPGDIRLDLSELDFCDAAGLGTMVALAGRVWPHARVVLDGVAPQLCKVLTVLRWDLRPNLVIHPRTPAPARPRPVSAR